MNITGKHIAALTLLAIAAWGFYSAPPPLPQESDINNEATIPISRVLEVVAKENDIARSLYTASIVGAGKKVGLSFSEDWKDEAVQAGPLPALFLREAAASIERSPVPLGLFLGSDFPISPSNSFSGSQDEIFARIKESREAEHFYDSGTGRHTAMFPDLASVMACVTCHNDHPDSPKTDWELNDVMGATTWSYPEEMVSAEEALQVVDAVRRGIADAYQAFLTEVEGFDPAVPIGDKWPGPELTVPSLEVFLAEFDKRASPGTLCELLELSVGG